MARLRDEKILITGPAGQIAFPLAARLARDNEVWGLARFGDPRQRERVEKAGVETRVIDLADPDWGDLPDDFGVVLHLAAAIVPGHDYDGAIRINALGTGKLMERHQNARACLVMSTCGVYLSPADGIHQYRLDVARRTQLAGPCKVGWKEGVRRMLATRRPDLELRDV